MSVASELAPLPKGFSPDWNRVRTVLLCQGEPDWVPFMEDDLDPPHKARVLGRRARSLADDLEIAQRIGISFVKITLGLQQSEAVRATMRKTRVDTDDGSTQLRDWAGVSGVVIESEDDFEAFDWPNPDQFDYSILEEADRLLPPNFKVMLAVGKIFNLGWWLMGFKAFSYALSDQPALIERLYAKIAQIQSRVVERVLEHKCVGCIRQSDDMAYKTGLMVAPRILRRYIFPVYKELNRECRLRDIPVLFHSDGKMDSLIEDIIDAGFDAFNPIEPGAMDIVALKKQVEGRLSLVGNVDLHHTLTLGTPAEVDAEVRGLMRMVAPGGGYGLASANSIPEYVPWRNFVAMHAAWLKYGRYPIAL